MKGISKFIYKVQWQNNVNHWVQCLAHGKYAINISYYVYGTKIGVCNSMHRFISRMLVEAFMLALGL